jgi:CYTH domain-containing protein/8-oxo-dGTP pyrophosphatase MutT (NUDIX family)
MRREVERKFFFDPAMWKLRSLQTTSLAQGYLADTGSWEIRLRRAGEDHRFTLKQGGGLDRGEWEVPVSTEAFEELWARTSGAQLTKERQSFALGGLVAEVDRYQGVLEGLSTVEVEFADRQQAAQFVPPKGFGPELTYDPRFKNRSLAKAVGVPCRWNPEGSTWSYGVIPFRQTSKGVELVMVSTRDHRRWIFPKGQPEAGRLPEQVAKAEALEEAGLSGRICGHPVVLPYQREQGTTNLLLFPFQVTHIASNWQESTQRERKVILLDQASLWGEVVSIGAQVIWDSLGAVGPRKKSKGDTHVKTG